MDLTESCSGTFSVTNLQLILMCGCLVMPTEKSPFALEKLKNTGARNVAMTTVLILFILEIRKDLLTEMITSETIKL